MNELCVNDEKVFENDIYVPTLYSIFLQQFFIALVYKFSGKFQCKKFLL